MGEQHEIPAVLHHRDPEPPTVQDLYVIRPEVGHADDPGPSPLRLCQHPPHTVRGHTCGYPLAVHRPQHRPDCIRQRMIHGDGHYDQSGNVLDLPTYERHVGVSQHPDHRRHQNPGCEELGALLRPHPSLRRDHRSRDDHGGYPVTENVVQFRHRPLHHIDHVSF